MLSFRIYLSTILLCCLQKAMCIFLQSLGKPGMSMTLSLLRDFILSVPLILLLPTSFGVVGPLYSAPVADVLSLLTAVFLMRRAFREMRAPDALEAL